ncbi:membrane protein [Salmonella enterica subsp. enterica serovar Choleraesuis]|nr:membrane protein [Salmonella enterica subsp. enterica serovar Choleraesuis]
MADVTFSKSLFGSERQIRQHIGNIAYYAFVACFFWAGFQLISLVFNASGVLEHLIQTQSNLRPDVQLSPLTSILFGLVAFFGASALVLTLIGGIKWFQRRREV